MDVMKITDQLPKVGKAELNPHLLALHAQEAAAVFFTAGVADNTLRSYCSALAYWSTWLQLRYGQVLGDAPLTASIAGQFVLDHLVLPLEDGCWTHLLPPDIDAILVAAGFKAKLGPLAFNTVSHRLTVLCQWHRLNNWDSPTDTRALKTLLAEARKSQSRQGVAVRKKTAAVLEPLQAMLATCTDGVLGLRDRALLLLAWSGGGRRRSEVVALQLSDVRRLDADTWLFALGGTDTDGIRREKPLRGPAAKALTEWLAVLPAESGPLFRRMYRGGKVGKKGLSADQVARIVQHRAKLAGLEGDWAAHSLRSGFFTEASRQGVHLGEIMAMTEHRSVSSIMGYYQNGLLVNSPATNLLSDPLSDEKINVATAPNRDTGLPAEYVEQEDWDLAIIKKFESHGSP
ncbi:tyrosine-type recombinase/integrase [Pseudomonas sp. IT-194MI4]|uniref:tyrosine-type recombinase/integrase n=1 Tax=Pseudomonas sp. IT-194MI4 TaxID=3026443 RepID=UPI0039E0719C